MINLKIKEKEVRFRFYKGAQLLSFCGWQKVLIDNNNVKTWKKEKTIFDLVSRSERHRIKHRGKVYWVSSNINCQHWL